MLGRPHVVINCRGKLVGRRVEAYWTVRRWRDRTRRLGIRGLSEWRPDRGDEWGVVDSPRIHRHPCGAASIARGLPYRVFVTGGGLTKVDAGHGSSASTGRRHHSHRRGTAATVLVAGRARRANSPSTTRVAVSSPSSRAAVPLAAMRSAVALNAPP